MVQPGLPDDVRDKARAAAIAYDDANPMAPDVWLASVDVAAEVAYVAGVAAGKRRYVVPS